MVELAVVMKQFLTIIRKIENHQSKLDEIVSLLVEPNEDKQEKENINVEEDDNGEQEVAQPSNEDTQNCSVKQVECNLNETKIHSEFNSMINQLVSLYGNEDSDKENCPEENDDNDEYGTKVEINISLFGICYEWPSVTALKKHNQQLKLQLEENQFGLELIMSRYRKHFLELLNESNKACIKLLNRYDGQKCKRLQRKILRLISEMSEMVTKYKEEILPSYEKIIMKQIEQINALRVQYNGLLEIYKLSKQADYYNGNNFNDNAENLDPNSKLIENSKRLEYDPKLMIESI